MANESLVVEDLTARPLDLTVGARERLGTVDAFGRRWLGGLNPSYVVVFAALLVAPFVGFGQYAISLLTEILVFSIFTMSLDLLLGYVGLPSFGHAAFLGLGAYAAAILSARLGISNLGPALIVAVVLASVGALILGVLALRTSGVYFLMLTLAFAQMISAVAQKWTPVTNGSDGLRGVKSPDLFVPGWTIQEGIPFYLFAVCVFALCFVLMFRIVHSPFGQALVGMHENEVRMRAIGYNVQLYRVAAFWIAGVFASVAGVLYAFFNRFISPDDVGFSLSGAAVLMVLIGGEGTLIGPVLGTAAYLLIQNYLSSYTDRWQLILGILFVVSVMFVRRGIIGLWAQIKTARFSRAAA